MSRVLKVAAIGLMFSLATYAISNGYRASRPALEQLWLWAADRGHAALRDDMRLRDSVARIPKYAARKLTRAELPKLMIDIKFKHMQKIYAKRAEALEKGVLIQADGDFVPASLRHANGNVKVKLRLKGDLLDHLRGDKWSFRIHVKGDDQIFGMRRFSLQHPKTRGFHGEVLFFESLRHLGVLAPRYLFVDVAVNGNAVGIMALEEHFSKELLESNGRRESVILKFDESLYWKEGAVTKGNPKIFNTYKNASIDGFRSSRIAKSPDRSREYGTAVGLLRGFVEGHLTTSSVFDANLLGAFLAVAEFWGSRHSIRWHNHRYYFNPITAKLEPIGFDGAVESREPPEVLIVWQEELVTRMLQDRAVFAAYESTLKSVAEQVLNGSLLQKLRDIEADLLTALQTEFVLLESFPWSELERRAKYYLALSENALRALPAKNEKAGPLLPYPALVEAFLVEDKGGPYLELSNLVPETLQVTSLQWVAKGGDGAQELKPVAPISLPLQLPPTRKHTVPLPSRIDYVPPPTGDMFLRVGVKVTDSDQQQVVMAKRYFAPASEHPIPLSSVEEQLSLHSFLTLMPLSNALLVLPGIWDVEESLIVPPGYSLKISGSTTLRFSPAAALIAHGPLEFLGNQANSIVLEGKEEEGNNSWPGIAVLQAGDASRWSNVVVRNTSGVQRGHWKLTGGVNFYESSVDMENCRFEGNTAEDALNVIRTQFSLTNVEIRDTASDGLDADFADGRIEGGLFHAIGKLGGGDAVDISGSNVSVTGARFEDIKDKALSVGERSKMTVGNIVIEHVGTGAASKDSSSMKISKSVIKDAQLAGLMAYVKKHEYGPAQIEANAVEFIGSAPFARVQTGSRVTIDGHVTATEKLDVEGLYQTAMRRGPR